MKRRLCASLRFFAVLGLSLTFVSVFGQPFEPEAKIKIADANFAKFRFLAEARAKERQDKVVAFVKTFKEVLDAKASDDGNMSCVFRDKMAYTILIASQDWESDRKASALLDVFRKPPAEGNGGGERSVESLAGRTGHAPHEHVWGRRGRRLLPAPGQH